MRKVLMCVALLISIGVPALADDTNLRNEEYLDFNYGGSADKGGAADWIQAIKVLSPAYRSDVKGDVTVEFEAKGMNIAKAMCWQQPQAGDTDKWGHDAIIASAIPLSESGKGSFVFKADEFPNGPINIRIFARSKEGKKDICELQLYNTGGVKWNQGMPKTPPPAAKGMTVAFEDEFDTMPTISADGKGTRYSAHKPTFGDFSGWPFTSPQGVGKPFAQRDTYLLIHASKEPGTKGMSGLLSPVAMDLSGYWAKPPFYMECRFIAQAAPGTWPAFWTVTNTEKGMPGDELDIVEAYGGVGRTLKGEPTPNHPGYSITSHFWGQWLPDGKTKKNGVNKRIDIMNLGGKSYWSTTFHTYGLYVDDTDTIYYFDDIEVLRHPTNSYSKNPHVFMINYAIGGISGWKVDLERYGNASDMYVDFVRVWEKKD